MNRSAPRPDRGLAWTALLPAATAVAAVYVYFLLYAQFGFLRLLEARGASALDVQHAMGAMGLAGLLASLGTLRLLARWPALAVLRAGLAGGALAALAALACHDLRILLGVAVLVGVSTACSTVALASRLRSFAGGSAPGLTVGLGTGTAYLVSNVPGLFDGGLLAQALAASGACAAGLAATAFFGREVEGEGGTALREADFTPLGFAAVVLAFLALIWLDSTAFAVIQATPALHAATWGGSGKLWIGITHFLAAVAAGRWIDRGRFHLLLWAAFGLFAAAFQLLAAGGDAGLVSGPLYAVGISIYSVALVVYPSYRGEGPGRVPRRVRAAVLYGVAGWLGSALGVGLAQEIDHVPVSLCWIAGGLLVVARLLRGGRLWRLARAHAVTLAFGLAGLLVFGPLASGGRPVGSAEHGAEADLAATVERGRQVYVGEGCINCHSQYVRPLERDRDYFGPRPADDGGASRPLYGNRRQGPDLSNAGARRSAAWHRLHLRDPRTLSPGSRMPSYAHLFDGDGRRGEDLVAYLASLGREASSAWYARVREFPMGESFTGGSPEHGRELFARYCAVCHGPGGRGDGPLATEVYRPAMNLTKGAFWGVSWGEGAEPRDLALARVIKFGLPGTSMPGHESLPDRDVADLAAWVLGLSRTARVAEQRATADPEVDLAG